MDSKIRYHKTEVDDRGEYREYSVYKKEGMFVAECIGWKIKSPTRQGGSFDCHLEFQAEKDAVAKFEELLAAWEK